ncbi:MAG: Galactose-1-phosphate uridylyltransferase [Acetothermia bacterium 64_32]|nr:MAG: Galactose-1-phosphate uridylyltransferase [Acetothermia bacterium 64_32]MBC7097853.1 galactose-1-phosphate uridylyltransferase [Candidatus Bipolaricaulota bacterium]HAF69908.1 galactose-1-phosphate uridylyltransferase [Candidatus Acetothermia bacterium]
MPELRKGPLVGRWVIVAPERGRRPSDFRVEAAPEVQPKEGCPFCPGNEHLTPPEVYRVPGPGGGWRVRVVPNKFPALSDYPALDPAPQGPFLRLNGVGAHEVVIDSPDHAHDLDGLSQEQVELVVEAWVHRLRALGERFHYVQLFRNHGGGSGASLSHPHSQIIATPLVPPEVEGRLKAALEHWRRHGTCVVCTLIEKELSSGVRVVEASERFLVLTPYDSRFPFELSIVPRFHSHDFRSMNPKDRAAFAATLRRTLARIKRLLGDIPYNLCLQTSPTPKGDWPGLPVWYHWQLELLPRLTRPGGFEWGTGIYINPMPPEEAARHLREVVRGG